MSDAPERIWAQPSGWPPNWKFGHWDLVDDGGENVEYVRADAGRAGAYPGGKEMRDLVERLREDRLNAFGVQRVRIDAADEIERLQAELREAQDVMRRVQSLNNAIRDDEGYHWAHASVIEEEITAFLAKKGETP